MRSPSPRSFENETSHLDVTSGNPIDRSNASHTLWLQDFAGSSTAQQQRIDQHVTHDADANDEDFPVPQEEESPEGKPQRPSMLPRPSSIARHASFLDGDELPPTSPPPSDPPTKQDKPGPVAWRDLPRKSQLALLTLARLSEPLTQTSLQAYMFYQLRSFDPSLPASTISAQAGMLQGSFTAAQFVTAILWGRMADAEWGGRKRVLLIGLAGTGVSCVGFGFSRSFWQAMVCRTLGGALNGNVGVMRTMISEIIKEKRFQSRAFLLLPMCFNIGTFGATLLKFVADVGCRRHCWANPGWIAIRSCEQLSECLRGKFALWRGERGLLAEALALRSPEFDECGLSVHLCYGSHFRAGRGMLATTGHQVNAYRICRLSKPYETDQTWVSASATSSPMPSVTFSAATLTTTPPSTLMTAWTLQPIVPGLTHTNSNRTSQSHPPRNQNQDGNCHCPASGPATSSAPFSATRS